MKDELRFKCLSVGMSGPNEVEQEPIQGRHLFAMPPGKSCSVINYIISIISYSPRKNKGIQAKLKIDHIIPRFRPITPTYLHKNYVYLYFYFLISHCNIARLYRLKYVKRINFLLSSNALSYCIRLYKHAIHFLFCKCYMLTLAPVCLVTSPHSFSDLLQLVFLWSFGILLIL